MKNAIHRSIELILLTALLLMAASSASQAQTTINVDISRATLAWDWVQGAGGPVEKFNVKCGQTPGVYSKTTVIADPAARSAPVRDIIAGSGQWFCAVSAENAFGPSADSSAIPFAAGAAPLAPTNPRVTAN